MKSTPILNIIILLNVLVYFSCNPDYGDPNSAELNTSKMELSENWDGTMIFNHPDNPFLQAIPDTYSVHPESAEMIELLKESCGPQFNNVRVGAGGFSKPIYLADSNTPVKDVKITLYNLPAGKEKMVNVPFVNGSSPADASDAHMVTIDQDSRCVYEFWLFNNFKSGSGNAISMDSDGIYEDGRSTVAAGWSQIQGIIWPKELREGLIEHALSFSCAVTNADGFVYPAKSNDGALTNTDFAIPEGTLIRIRPDVNVDTISNINEIDKTLYRALQTYGMYCGDTNGAGISMGAIAQKSLPANAYPDEFDINNEFGAYYVNNFPFALMEVVYTGEIQKGEFQEYVDHGCAEWE